MRRILIVEDDPNIAKSLIFNIEQSGLSCVWAPNISQAQSALAMDKFSLFLLDVGLPDGTGISLCKLLRDNGQEEPIILLTARQDEESLEAGFAAGATDYVKKPFSNRELMARVKANLLRSPDISSELQFKGLSLNPEKRQCTFNGHALKLNRKQFDTLYFLLSNQGRIVTRDALLRFLGREDADLDRVVDVHVSQVRKHLKAASVHDIEITSVYGLGYTIEK